MIVIVSELGVEHFPDDPEVRVWIDAEEIANGFTPISPD